MRKILFSVFIVLAILAVSCKKTLPDIGQTATQKASNGWWVNYYVDGAPQLPSPVFFTTYNSSSSADSMWIDDLSKFWQFKGKVKIDYPSLTFGATGSENDYYPSTANIANGKILPKAGHSRAGNVTDSIYMEIQFSDDSPAFGTTYIISGTARTGFIEDDY